MKLSKEKSLELMKILNNNLLVGASGDTKNRWGLPMSRRGMAFMPMKWVGNRQNDNDGPRIIVRNIKNEDNSDSTIIAISCPIQEDYCHIINTLYGSKIPFSQENNQWIEFSAEEFLKNADKFVHAFFNPQNEKEGGGWIAEHIQTELIQQLAAFLEAKEEKKDDTSLEEIQLWIKHLKKKLKDDTSLEEAELKIRPRRKM